MDTDNTIVNAKVEKFIERFEDSFENNPVISDEDLKAISAEIPDRETLNEGMPLLKETSDNIKSMIDDCSKKVKMWQESKSAWENRDKQFNRLLGVLLGNLSMTAIKAGKIKISTSNRTSIEVDEEWLLGQYQAYGVALQAQLPPYIKVKLSIDKNALNAFLKQDNTMLIDNPDKIHSKTSSSTTIK